MQITFSTSFSAPEPVTFGADTLAAAGGIAKPSGATSISDAGGTNLVLSSGYAVPDTGGGVTSGNVLWDDGTIWAVTAEPNAYSVRDITELTTAANHASVALGDTIYMRGGDYNAAQTYAAVNRTSAGVVSGTWTGSNYVTIKPHAGEVCTLYRILFTAANTKYFSLEGVVLDTDGLGSGQTAIVEGSGGASYCRVKDCTGGADNHSPTNMSHLAVVFYCPTGGVICDNWVFENNVIDGLDQLAKWAGRNCTWRGNEVRNSYGDSWTIIAPASGCTMIGNTSTDKPGPHQVKSVTNITAGATTVITVDDATGISTSTHVRVTGFTGTNNLPNQPYLPLSVVGNDVTLNVTTTGTYTGGGSAYVIGAHSDHVQFLGNGSLSITGVTTGNPTVLSLASAGWFDGSTDNLYLNASSLVGPESLVTGQYAVTNVSGTNVTIAVDTTGETAWSSGGTVEVGNLFDDMTLEGNFFTRGTGSTDFVGGQGIFASNYGPVCDNWQVHGNIVTTITIYGIGIPSVKNSSIRYNSCSNIPGIYLGQENAVRISVGPDSDATASISSNVAQSYSVNGSSAVLGSNTTVGVSGTAIEAVFVNPQNNEERVVTSADYALVASSAPDLENPKHGAYNHVDWDTGVFTDPDA